MKTHQTIVLCILLFATLQIACSKDPGITIASPSPTATVYGYVSPYEKPAKVSIIRDGDTLASTISDTLTGRFIFRNIPFDIYTFSANTATQHGESFRTVDEQITSLSSINLYTINSIITNASPSNVLPLKPDSTKGDSLVRFRFSKSSSALSEFGPCSLSISPSSLLNQVSFVLNDQSTGYFTIPKLAVFSVTEFSIVWRARKVNPSGILKADSATYTYRVDTTGIGRAKTLMLLLGYSPYNYNYVVNNVFREDSMTIRFSRPMNHDSVEKSIVITPSISKTFSWNNNQLTITPSNALNKLTTYTVLANQSAMSLDSIHFGTPFEFSFTTGDMDLFSSQWPLNGSTCVPLSVPFEFSFPYSITPELIQSAFSITPAVDSLNFTMSSAGIVTVSHSALLADTTYQIAIDSSCQSRKGVILGKDLLISFRTISTH